MPWLHNKDSLEINSLNSRQEKAKTIVSNNKRISVKLKFFPSFKGGKKKKQGLYCTKMLCLEAII
jgi:hypothetical protein